MNAVERSHEAAASRREAARVRCFIVAHGVALAVVYVLAWFTGEGWAGPPMPPQSALASGEQASWAVQPAPPVATQVGAQDELPAWARRADVSPTWVQAR